MKQIAAALVEAQKEMGNAVKGNTNPFFRSQYADLNSVREACIPHLNAHGISVIQPMVHIEGRNFVKTVLLHVSGEMIESFTEIIYAKTNDAQAQGSGITYARRYGLQSLVNIGSADDDGNAASQPQPTQAAKPTASNVGKKVIDTATLNRLYKEFQSGNIDKAGIDKELAAFEPIDEVKYKTLTTKI